MSDIPTCFCRRSDVFLTCACGGCTGVPWSTWSRLRFRLTMESWPRRDPSRASSSTATRGTGPATTICARCWDIHGRSCARRIGLKITHPDDLAADVEQFERVLNGETDGYSINKRFIRKDGRVIDTKPEPRPQGEATENLIDTAPAVSRDNLRDAQGKSVTPSIGTPCSTESSIALGEGVDRSEESKAILERIWRVYWPGGIPRSRDPLNK